MRNKKGRFFIISGMLLIAAALCLAEYNLYESYRAGNSSVETAKRLEKEISEDVPESEEISDYEQYPEMEMPVKTIDGRDYIGILQIPVLNLELPVISNWNYSDLKTAPCRYSGSVYLNNLVIAAHNYSSHFGRLKNLCEGDLVIFEDVEGNTFTYTAAGKEVLNSTDVEEMESGEWDLTLFTCTLDGKMRTTIRCVLTD